MTLYHTISNGNYKRYGDPKVPHSTRPMVVNSQLNKRRPLTTNNYAIPLTYYEPVRWRRPVVELGWGKPTGEHLFLVRSGTYIQFVRSDDSGHATSSVVSRLGGAAADSVVKPVTSERFHRGTLWKSNRDKYFFFVGGLASSNGYNNLE